MKRRKTDRRPERRQHLNVRHLREPVRRKRKREGGDDGGVVPSRERERQKVRSHRAEDERGDERDVVAEQRQMRQHGQRRADRRQAQKVLRECERARRRKKRRRVPPVGGQRNGLRGPPQDPRIEERIAGIVWNTVTEVQRQGPCVRKVIARYATPAITKARTLARPCRPRRHVIPGPALPRSSSPSSPPPLSAAPATIWRERSPARPAAPQGDLRSRRRTR